VVRQGGALVGWVELRATAFEETRMISTIYVLLALTIWMGEELEVHVVNVFPTQADCMKALAVETQHTNGLPHCCGGAETLRCFAWSGQSLKPHAGPYYPKPLRPLDR
jgi:hypothetical protein